MSEIVTAAEKIVDIVEKSKMRKTPLLLDCMEQLYRSSLGILNLLSQNNEISDEKFYEYVMRLHSTFSPYVKPRTMEYYEKAFGKKAFKLIKEFLVME